MFRTHISIKGLYLGCLYYLTHFCSNVKSNIIMKRETCFEMLNKFNNI